MIATVDHSSLIAYLSADSRNSLILQLQLVDHLKWEVQSKTMGCPLALGGGRTSASIYNHSHLEGIVGSKRFQRQNG